MRLVVVRHGDELALAEPEALHRAVAVVLKVVRLPHEARPLLDRDDALERHLAVALADEALDELAERDVARNAHGDVHGAAHGAVRVGRAERAHVKDAARRALEPDGARTVPRATQHVE